MAVLIVGGAGFIGSQTAKEVAAQGLELVVFDNLSTGHRWALNWGAFEEGDLNDPAALDRVFEQHQISAVIHFAAKIEVGESVRDPRKYFRNNVVNTLNLLDAMVAHQVRHIVFSSTAAVYGSPHTSPITEQHPLDPLSPYGDSKFFDERILRWYGDAYGLRSVALRYFNAAGADPDGQLGEAHTPESHLIPLAIAAARGGTPLKLFGTDYPTPDGTAVRDYIHVADLALAHVLAVRHLEAGRESFVANVGTGVGHSVRQVIETVARVTGSKVPYAEVERRPGDPPELVADAHEIEKRLGWQPRYPELETMVEHAVRWQSSPHAR
ncbi:MAG: UDP-glucose 4-epimerase GalE [Polyangiaceae bacterium]